MSNRLKFYINGSWQAPLSDGRHEVINPATEEVAGVVAMAGIADVDRAVAAARSAFASYSQTTKDDRIAMLEAIKRAYRLRVTDIAATVTSEMGAPSSIASSLHAGRALHTLEHVTELLKGYDFHQMAGTTRIVRWAPPSTACLSSR